MRGLLMKDFYMLLEMKKFAGMMAAIGLLLLITNSGGEGFVISYMTIMSAFMVLSTLSQDEGGKGIQFLLTLPVTRKIYVKEKYCLGLLNGIVFWLVSAVAVGLATAVRNRETVPVDFIWECLLYLTVLFAMLALMLPVQLKYGGEKGRLVIVIAVAVILCVAIGSAKFMEGANVDASGAVEWIAAYNVFCYGLRVAVLLALLWISYRISLHVMEKKQY